MELKDLNFTEEDFDLLVEGLRLVPDKHVAGEMVGDLLLGVFNKSIKDPKIKTDYENKKLANAQKRKAVFEDCTILQGKLLQLKKYFISQGILTNL